LVTIGSGVSEGAGVEFPTFPLTCVVVLKTLWHYRASVWFPGCGSMIIWIMWLHPLVSAKFEYKFELANQGGGAAGVESAYLYYTTTNYCKFSRKNFKLSAPSIDLKLLQ